MFKLFGRSSIPAESGGYAVIAPLVEAVFGVRVPVKRALIFGATTWIASSVVTFYLLPWLRRAAGLPPDAAANGAGTGSAKSYNTSLLESIDSVLQEVSDRLTNLEATNATQTARGTRTSSSSPRDTSVRKSSPAHGTQDTPRRDSLGEVPILNVP